MQSTTVATLTALRLEIERQERIRFGCVAQRVRAARVLARTLGADADTRSRSVRDALDVARLGVLVDVTLAAVEAGLLETDGLTFGSFVRRGRAIRAAETRRCRAELTL